MVCRDPGLPIRDVTLATHGTTSFVHTKCLPRTEPGDPDTLTAELRHDLTVPVWYTGLYCSLFVARPTATSPSAFATMRHHRTTSCYINAECQPSRGDHGLGPRCAGPRSPSISPSSGAQPRCQAAFSVSWQQHGDLAVVLHQAMYLFCPTHAGEAVVTVGKL
jgi:hypothetical protein